MDLKEIIPYKHMQENRPTSQGVSVIKTNMSYYFAARGTPDVDQQAILWIHF